MIEVLLDLWNNSGIAQFFIDDGWKNALMILAAFVLFYLAIRKEFEPLLLLPIAFGMLLTNLPWPGGGIFHPDWSIGRPSAADSSMRQATISSPVFSTSFI